MNIAQESPRMLTNEKNNIDKLIIDFFGKISGRIARELDIDNSDFMNITQRLFSDNGNSRIIATKEMKILLDFMNNNRIKLRLQKILKNYFQGKLPESLLKIYELYNPIWERIKERVILTKTIDCDKIIFDNERNNVYVLKDGKFGIYEGGNPEEIQYYNHLPPEDLEFRNPSDIQIKMLGTRGSAGRSGESIKRHGGNTTCLSIQSEAIPEDSAVFIDAGTGILEEIEEMMKKGIKNIIILLTHNHTDHLAGLTSLKQLYNPNIKITFFGTGEGRTITKYTGNDIPEDMEFGPHTGVQALMKNPLHPIDFTTPNVAPHLNFVATPYASNRIVFHPELGMHIMTDEEITKSEGDNTAIEINGKEYPFNDFMIMDTIQTNHITPTPTLAYSIIYRGKKTVFMTDHENSYPITDELKTFLYGADLLIIDAAYSDKEYKGGDGKPSRIGRGHSTPTYIAELAQKCGIQTIGTTHHDCCNDDFKVWDILIDIQKSAPGLTVFSCRDNDQYNI